MAITPQYQPRNPDRAKRWDRRAPVRWPQVIEHTNARLDAVTATPHGRRYCDFFDSAPVAGGGERQRAKRIDGATNVVTMMQTLVAAADIDSGVVATPGGGRGERWQRKSWADLHQLAYGPEKPGQVSMRRTERAARELIEQGYIRVVEYRTLDKSTGEYRSKPGTKFVTEKFWKVLGMWPSLRRERRRREKVRQQAKSREILELAGLTKSTPPVRPGRPPTAATSSTVTASAGHDPPPPEPPDPEAASRAREAALLALKTMKAVLR